MAQKVVSHVRLMVTIPIDVAKRVVDAWARGMKAEAEDMYAKMKSRVPSMDKFQSRVVGPAITAYSKYVNPNFISRSGKNEKTIKSGRAANLRRSYQKYLKKLEFYFETVDGVPAKRFKELIEKMKGSYGAGTVARTLPITGTKIEGLGAGPLALRWLTKDITIEEHLRSGDKILSGNPMLICRVVDAPAFRSALQGRLNQAGAEIIKADFNPVIRQEENDRTNRIVQMFVDPALNIVPFTTGGASRLDYIMVDEQPFLEIKVSVTT